MVLCYCKKPGNSFLIIEKLTENVGGVIGQPVRHSNLELLRFTTCIAIIIIIIIIINNKPVNIFTNKIYFDLKPTATISSFFKKSLLTCIRI